MRTINAVASGVMAMFGPGSLLPALAVIVNVDFQPGGSGGGTAATFNAQGALASPGNTWNVVAPSTDGSNNGPFGSGGRFDFSGDPYTAGSLLNSGGGATSLGVEVFKGDPDSAFALNPANGFDANIADDAKELMRDYLISGWGTDPNSVNIVGLTPGSTYTLYLYGAGDNDAVSTTFTINGVDKSTTGVPGGAHNLTLNQDYVVFTGVASNGTISIAYKNNGESADGHFNGFQISYSAPASVPTLSEWGMILLAAGLLAVAYFTLRNQPSASAA